MKSGNIWQYPAVKYMPDNDTFTAKQSQFGRTPLDGLSLEFISIPSPQAS
jgi:hypothetical protein